MELSISVIVKYYSLIVKDYVLIYLSSLSTNCLEHVLVVSAVMESFLFQICLCDG